MAGQFTEDKDIEESVSVSKDSDEKQPVCVEQIPNGSQKGLETVNKMDGRDTKKLSQRKRPFTVSYFWLMWTSIIVLTFITVLDRFTTNLWPLWVCSIFTIIFFIYNRFLFLGRLAWSSYSWKCQYIIFYIMGLDIKSYYVGIIFLYILVCHIFTLFYFFTNRFILFFLGYNVMYFGIGFMNDVQIGYIVVIFDKQIVKFIIMSVGH